MEHKEITFFNIENYWIDKEKYCLTFFNRASRNGKKAIYDKYGRKEGDQILNLVKKEYQELLSKAPYVGEVDIMKRQMLLIVIFTGFYRVLKDREKIEDIWNLCNNFNQAFLLKLPKLIRWLIKQSTFSKKFKREFEKNSIIQNEKNLADQWDYIEGDKETFDYGTNITRCAKLIFLQQLGHEEFLPYICKVDKNFAECCNYGFKRSQTLANGAEFCDFRLSKNGPIIIEN